MFLESLQLGTAFPPRVVVVRALPGLGDLLCVVPALRALRSALPRAEITLVGLPAVRPLAARYRRYLDGFIDFPGFPGIPERPLVAEETAAFFLLIQRRRFDLAIQMHGSGITSNAFTALLGARYCAGFFLPGQSCPDPERFLPYPAHEPEVRRHLQLVEFLGAPRCGDHLEFPILEDDVQALARLDGTRHLAPGSYVVVHPGATLASRRWPEERFAAVADGLARQGRQVVLTGVPGEEPITAAVTSAMRAPAIDLTGRTTLGSMAALLAGAALLVSNDTGVSHLAAALRTPSVVVFTVTDPVRWAPLDRRRHRPVGRRTLEGPCEHPSTSEWHRALRDGCTATNESIGEPPPADVTPEAVLREARALLMREYADAA